MKLLRLTQHVLQETGVPPEYVVGAVLLQTEASVGVDSRVLPELLPLNEREDYRLLLSNQRAAHAVQAPGHNTRAPGCANCCYRSHRGVAVRPWRGKNGRAVCLTVTVGVSTISICD